LDLASHVELAVDPASPKLVSVRAETKVLVAIEALASAAKIVCRQSLASLIVLTLATGW
jgi:hypothetical protein